MNIRSYGYIGDGDDAAVAFIRKINADNAVEKKQVLFICKDEVEIHSILGFGGILKKNCDNSRKKKSQFSALY